MSNKYLNEEYLGDGLYADFDGYQFILKTLREDGIHFIFLDQMVLANFIRYTHEVNQKIQSQLNINIRNAIDNGQVKFCEGQELKESELYEDFGKKE